MAYTHKLSRRLAMLDGVCAAALLATIACSDDLPVAPSLTIPPASSDLSTSATVVLVGAGNIARCQGTNDEATATLLDGIAGTVYTLGDNTHHSGSSWDFANCFGGSWGRHKSRVRPTVGDNEYQTAGASGYFGYFGASAGPSGKGYYSYDIGDWHVVVLNSQISTAAGSAQEQWLRADLAASTKACTIGIWHEPRFSSYGTRVRADVKPLWDALYAAGAEIVLNGHYEHYERFALQRPDGTADAQRGIRQFIVGTGGEGTEPFGTPLANSQVRKNGAYGVLKLTLSAGSYSWQFVPVAGQTFSDAGTGSCSGSGGPTPGPVTTVTVTPATASTAVGGTVPLSAIAKDSAGTTVPAATMTWTTLNSLVASVAASGLVTGLSAGTAKVVATSAGKSDTATVTVTTSGGGTPRKGYYAAPNGTSSASGAFTSPWDLKTALAGGNGKVQPGDTIWLRGGTYRGAFRSTVRGTASAPVVVRQFPGERATIDGAGTSSSTSTFYVGGAYSVFWGFEITNSDPTRNTSSLSNNWRPNVVVNYASNTKYVNLVVRDGGVAFYNDPPYSNVEIVGCIIYNNGWQAPDRGHGHGLYLKSISGPIIARDNIIFNQFGYGVHAYTDQGSGKLVNIQLDGNVAFNNGTMSNNSTSSNILLGGGDYATGDVVKNNLAYFSPSASGTNVKIGYSTTKNGTVQVQSNYFAGGSPVFDLGYWSSANVSSNTFIGSSSLVTLNDNSLSGKVFASNTHQRDPLAKAWKYGGTSYAFLLWKTTTGLALTDQAVNGMPNATKVVVRENPYEAGRANVVVYNWGNQGSVTVNASGFLSSGDHYEVRNVQNMFGAPVVSGTYGGGSITIPMGGVTPPAPVGMSTSRSPRTGPDFDVFVVVKK